MLKQQALDVILEKVKSLEIKSIHINGKIYDKFNIDNVDITLDDDVWISKQYLKLFVNDDLLSYIYRYYIKDKDYDYFIIRRIGSKTKINTFNISNHARKSFMKRYILLALNKQCHFILKEYLIDELNKNLQYMIDSYKSDTIDKSIIDPIIISFLTKSKELKGKTISRPRDQRHLRNRDKKYKNTLRLYHTPFLFVISENVIVTSELWSSSFEFRHMNSVSDKKFQYIIKDL